MKLLGIYSVGNFTFIQGADGILLVEEDWGYSKVNNSQSAITDNVKTDIENIPELLNLKTI
jgi:hypothetical protein